LILNSHYKFSVFYTLLANCLKNILLLKTVLFNLCSPVCEFMD